MQNDRPECIHQITLRLKRKAGTTCQDSFPQKLTKANKDKTRCALSAAFRPGKEEEEEEEENTKSFGWTRKDIESRRAMRSINLPKSEQQLIKEEGDPVAAETQVTPSVCWWNTCESSPSSRFSGATGSADIASGNIDTEPYSEGRSSEESSISLDDDDDDDFPYYLVPDPSTSSTSSSS